MRGTFGVSRIFLSCLLGVFFTMAVHYPCTAYAGDGSKVYLEGDCLAVLGAGPKAAAALARGDADETIVEEDKGYLAFDRVTVIEKRDSAVTDAYVQVRNCRMVKGQHSPHASE